MNNFHVHYNARGPFNGGMLIDIVEKYEKSIGPTIQRNCKSFMISKSPNVSNNNYMFFRGKWIAPVFGKNKNLGSVLSLEGFLRLDCDIDHFDHFALLFGTRNVPEIGDTTFGHGASAIYVSFLNRNRSVISVPHPSGIAYAEDTFLKAAGVDKYAEIESGWLPILPELKVIR